MHYAREIQIPSLTLIYPAIQPGHRLGLQKQPVPRLQDDVCFLGWPPAFAAVPQYLVHTLGVLHPTMPAADFRYAMGSPYGSLSLGAPSKMTLHSNGLFPVWTASGCIDHPQMACFAFLASQKIARFRCNDSFCSDSLGHATALPG